MNPVYSTYCRVGQYVSLDCEFVGLYDQANDHSEHSLARVSIVNYHGAIVLDTFVAQREKVGDWRTWVSGVRPEDVINGAIQIVLRIFNWLIGHSSIIR